MDDMNILINSKAMISGLECDLEDIRKDMIKVCNDFLKGSISGEECIKQLNELGAEKTDITNELFTYKYIYYKTIETNKK